MMRLLLLDGRNGWKFGGFVGWLRYNIPNEDQPWFILGEEAWTGATISKKIQAAMRML